ncbi:glycosyltransferase family 39 protein [Streptomyces sp. VRA16 Mangrove soil]|uniref:ArnT family glycosyltransferase n=1 Tax=Streptomyces sp. VRA16 Mangrove soil TaxID=2817434 RepID=UPI001A9D419A|nr:glycosyltransferase family 39 protein [Streptomyces sp. VRA16 Mangrove soil]MBO1330983.1 glycosyltransferase family 39 protein [Streptomyces sp. VRA16 Mangrove soil]
MSDRLSPPAPASHADPGPSPRSSGRGAALRRAAPLTAVLLVAVFLRFFRLTATGFNSDEAVYAGTSASLAGDPGLGSLFPVFRAHPVLFQSLVSLALRAHPGDWAARAVPALLGTATVAMTYALGRRLYGRRAGIVAALLLAVMPYHVVVSRQVLLDAPMTLGATAALYCVARYAESPSPRGLLATGAVLGLTFLAKETSIVLLGSLYAFFALTPSVRTRWRHLLPAFGMLMVVALAHPLSQALAGHSKAGGNYLLWQMFRKANHPYTFYGSEVPLAVGLLVVVAAVAGLVWLRRENTWRERLLVCWVAVPALFFTVWPVKGFQYLLPAAPVFAVLAGRTLVSFPRVARWQRVGAAVTVCAVVVATAVPAALAVTRPPTSTRFLAGSGGLPGGREAGHWVRANAPDGARLLAIGPSMANVVQYYGLRPVSALSVSPDPARRNPSYRPVPNPDRAMRDGTFQYLVWDAYTARRTPFFTAKFLDLVGRYHGRPVFTAHNADGVKVVVVYRVRAS